jgi:nucleoid-associated protein YgaU
MSDEEKKKFFNNIEKTWKGKGAKQEQVSELTDAQKKLPPALQKAIEKKDGKDESTDKKEEVKESIIKEGFATWEMSFSDMNLNGVKLSKKNKYKVKARNTVEAIKKAAKMAGLKGNDWIATQTNYLKKIG